MISTHAKDYLIKYGTNCVLGDIIGKLQKICLLEIAEVVAFMQAICKDMQSPIDFFLVSDS